MIVWASCLAFALKIFETISLPLQKGKRRKIFSLLPLLIHPDFTGVSSQVFILVGVYNRFLNIFEKQAIHEFNKLLNPGHDERVRASQREIKG